MSFKCHICPKEHDTEDDLRIHLLFTHQFFKQACETNRVVIDWEHKNYVHKTRAWNRGCVKAWENKSVPPRWLQFWDLVEGTSNYKEQYNAMQRVKQKEWRDNNPEHKERKRVYYQEHRERYSQLHRLRYQRMKEEKPEKYEAELLKKKEYARDYNSVVVCSLCGMEFDKKDELYKVRRKKHTMFHKTARIQGRNTANGTPEYKSKRRPRK